MSNYTQITDFSAKDALASGDPEKIATGADIDAELAAIATAIESKANTASPTFTGTAALPAGSTLGGTVITAFPSGTAMLFAQTAAPTGWTKSTTHNDKALRVVSGTASSGGATAFTSVFGSSKTTGSTTLTVNQIPSHSHVQTGSVTGGSDQVTAHQVADSGTLLNHYNSTGSTGGGSGHDHTLSLDLQYVDVIIATKD